MRKQSISCTLQVAGCRLKKIFTSIILASCILHLASFNLFAAPHLTREKPEPFHGVGKRLSERMKAGMLAPMMVNKTSGTVRVLFLKVDFQQESTDDATTTGDGTWSDPAYSHNSDPDYWVKKDAIGFVNYYNEVSYAQLNLTVEVFPKTAGSAYRLPNPMTSYGNESNTVLENLIKDSVAQAKAAEGTAINFSQYDAILIVHAGAGEETDTDNNTTNDLWSLYYGAGTTIVTVDGINITEAIIMPQTGSQDSGTVDPLGIYVHEFGHWLGLPDLYYTASFPPKLWDGVGKWSLMGDGIYLAGADTIRGSSPSHLDAWCKTYLGWVTPQTISTDNAVATLNPVETNKQIIKLQAGNTTSKQYFLLENRQQTGFDVGLPGGGLLVWLIDDDVITTKMSDNAVNNNPLRPGVALMEADGKQNLKNYNDGDYGSSGDPFPGTSGKTSFTPYTNPSSTPYTGSAWLYLKDIATDVSNNVTLTIGFAPAAPTNLSYTLNSSTRLTWTASTDAAKYLIYKNGSFLAETTETQYTDSSASNGTYTVSAVDANGYESARSASVTVSFSSSGGDNSSAGCFIATAAYGSYEAPYVRILREFRDSYLIKSFEFRVPGFEFEIQNYIGKAFVQFYYNVSPPMADFIRESETLKGIVRVMLLPLIGIAAFLVKTSLVLKLMIFGALLVVNKPFTVRRFRR